MSSLRFWKRQEQIPASELGRTNPVRFGIIVIVALAIAVYFGFAKHLPFQKGFQLKGVFATAQNIAPKSPVRVAGINVGVVKSVKREGSVGVVTMEIENKGLPIHSDATLKIRPRIFLEGNWFVELQPGSPSGKTVGSGYTIPITQTANPVQLDQVLDALNSDTRTNLQEFLAEYGKALEQKPTPAEDAIQEPEVRGLNGAQGFNKAYQLGPRALRGSAIVNQALAGSTRRDIAKLIASADRVTKALDVHEQELGEWVDNFNTFIGELAAQSSSLGRAVAELPGALHNAHRAFNAFNAAFPSVRSFAKAIIPGVKQTPATIALAEPWIEQVKASLTPSELGGVAQGLREGAPWTARLVGAQAGFQKQTDEFSKCLTRVIFPAGNTKLQDGSNTTGVEDYKEFWYTMVGLAGIGQTFDGNGMMTSFLVGGGGPTFRSAPVTEINSSQQGVQLVARTPLIPKGTRPALPRSEPPYKPLVPCYTQSLPEFNGPLSEGPADGSGG